MRNKDLEWLAMRCDDMMGAKYISREGNRISLTSKPYNHGGSYTHGEWKAARCELGLDKTLDDATPAECDAASRAARDLKWLAENVKEWAEGATGIRRDRQEGWYAFVYGDCNSDDREWFTKAEWLNAIGDSEYLKIAQERMNDESVPVTVKQLRYLDNDGRDWIDECAATMTVDEFRGAMKFTIGKYVRRAGKKDAIESEIRKIEDYARRWAEYERDIELEERK